MDKATLRARRREATGTRPARRLRQSGQIPAVLYGRSEDPQPIQIDNRDFQALIKSGLTENTLITLLLDDEKSADRVTIIREVQRDPVRDDLRHIDLVHIDMTREIEVEVPLVLEGTPEGVKVQGGILEQRIQGIDIKCLPADIPENFTLDVSELTIGDTLHVSDVEFGDFEILTDTGRAAATVVAPRLELEVEEEEEEVLGEPALVGEEEELEEGEEPAEEAPEPEEA
ncbi:MAG: 50S ribosomal protein L25 [bacterium]